MCDVITIGVDLAKSVFQVRGVDAAGAVVVRRRLRRRQMLPFFEMLPPCLVGMEACATAHHWGREIERLGHRVRLMPPRYVKAYVKIQKNDAADAEAICEAVTRPTMRFVELKTSEQQSILIPHRTRQLFVRQRITLNGDALGIEKATPIAATMALEMTRPIPGTLISRSQPASLWARSSISLDNC